MGDVINLRLHRKRKERTGREAKAAENRARFGTSKADRELDRLRTDLEARRLEGHRLADSDEQGEASN